MPGRRPRTRLAAAVTALLVGGAGAAACGREDSPGSAASTTASQTTSEAPATSATAPTTTADDVCRLVTFDEATAILGPGTSADVTGSARCIYRRRNVSGVDREIAVEPGKIPNYDYKSLDDFVRFWDSVVAKGNAERISGVGDSAYFDTLEARIMFVRGSVVMEITMVLSATSADFNKGSDKSTERDTLVRLARNAVARL